MIAGMVKVHMAVRKIDQERFMKEVRELGVLHLVPVDPDMAVADEGTLHKLSDLNKALQLLATVEPDGTAPDLDPVDAARQSINAFQEISDSTTRIAALENQISCNQMWGEVSGSDYQWLQNNGIHVKFFRIPKDSINSVESPCIEGLGPLGKQQFLIGLAYENPGDISLPPEAVELEPPAESLSQLSTKMQALRVKQKELDGNLKRIANLTEGMKTEIARLEGRADWIAAIGSGLSDEGIFAVSGWVPEDEADLLAGRLENAGIIAGVQTMPADPDDEPPTYVRTPKWARPIEGMFKILGTIPGYREFDISGAFLIALPIFSAMLIADGGYGLLLFLVAAIFYKGMSNKFGKPLTQLVMIIGGVSVLWGFAISSFFGFGDADFKAAGGLLANVGSVLASLKLIESTFTADTVVRDIMRLSFIIGTIHMSFAHLWSAARKFPSLTAIANIGWAVFLWGMLMVVQTLVLELPAPAVMPYLLGGGALLVVLFTSPQKNILKTVGLGFASFPLSALSTLSDTISYIRLMAVGLASTILAATFNGLAVEVASGATWIAGGLVLVVGHGLNIGLAIIALFAHGVRLNMLEFSQCLSMAWNGTKYKPFASKNAEEIQ